MRINTLGEFLKYYRQKYEFGQEKLCSGICSLATLSRVEKGDRIIDSLMAESLLGRIEGYSECLVDIEFYHKKISELQIMKKLDNPKCTCPFTEESYEAEDNVF